LIEIVSGDERTAKAPPLPFHRDRGYEIRTHDLAKRVSSERGAEGDKP
jgi:hypothetical protein